MDIKQRIAQWIPTHVSPKLVVWVYGVLDRLIYIKRSVRKENRSVNDRVLNSESSPYKQGYIENQSEWKDIKFGRSTMAFSGCEIMAVYNVLYALDRGRGAKLIGELIEEFEKSGAALKGVIGSSPKSIRRHLLKRGIDCSIVWKEEDIDPDCKLAIATVYNDKKSLYSQIHTITFTKDENGFRAHNARSRQKYYPTLREAINGVGSDPKMICAIQIDKSL